MKILAILAAIVAALFIIGGLSVMFLARDAAGMFLFVGGAALAYWSGREFAGPVRSFEDQYRDLG